MQIEGDNAMGAVVSSICCAGVSQSTEHNLSLLPLLCAQIEGDHAMDAVFSSICCALDAACAKIDDPLEAYCSKNPSEMECLVYDD